MAARQLPPGHRRRSATSASNLPAHLLPARCRRSPRASTPATRGSTRWPSSWCATATAGSIASSSTVFLNSYQRVAPLTIGELWAWPSMLKLALIENLRRLAEETAGGARARAAPPTPTSSRADETRRHAAALPPGLGSRVRSSSCCIASASTGCGCRRSAPRSTSTSRAQQTTAEDGDSRRAPASGRRPGVGGQRRSPACASARRSTGRSTSSRSAWSSRCCSAIPRAPTDGWTS